MRVRFALFLTAVGALVLMAGPAAQRAATDTWTPPRTPWGDPDLQGIYTNKIYRGASSGLKVTERFTPVSPNVLSWTARMEDPTTWERPWTIRMPLKRDDTQAIFEFGCHEGNRALENIMRAARAGEARQAAEGR